LCLLGIGGLKVFDFSLILENTMYYFHERCGGRWIFVVDFYRLNRPY
jgi:hypothetical protein